MHQVKATKSFIHRLQAIETFLISIENKRAYEELLNDLANQVVPCLGRFPLIGRPFLNQQPQSVESLTSLAQISATNLQTLREYIHKSYIVLYSVDEKSSVVYLLTIRHHRELSFNFEKLWEF